MALDFAAPPNAARPRVWWHWLDGNVTREGIAQDLAWLKRVGIAGVQNFDVAFGLPQVVDKPLNYMSPEWKETFRYAVERAQSLDLEFAIAASPGWSETGGPWVKPQQGMKKLVWSETVLAGGSRFNGMLPAPPTVNGPYQSVSSVYPPGHEQDAYYADVAVVAYPVEDSAAMPPPQSATSNGAPFDASVLLGDDLSKGAPLPEARENNPGVVELRYAATQTVRSATVFVSGLSDLSSVAPTVAQLEVSETGQSWRKIADIGLVNVPTTVSFSPVRARHFRLSLPPLSGPLPVQFTPSPGADTPAMWKALGFLPTTQNLVQFELSPEARVNEFERKAGFVLTPDYFALDRTAGPEMEGVPPAAVIDLGAQLSADGRLDWTPPPGRWKVLRLGYSLTGKTNHPARAEATGLEVDKFDAAAVEAYTNAYLDMYRDATGAALMGERGVRALMVDSIETGASNWTPRLAEHFRRLRGYDLLPWLPALTGDVVGSRAQSDAFLYDFRRTLADLISTEHYGTVAKVAHERGLIVYGEALEGMRLSLGDDLDMRGSADIPMAALWSYDRSPSMGNVADARGAASIAHLQGRQFVACESLTSAMQPWAHAPSDLQPMADAIFACGVNRPVIHTSVHQPTEQAPGLALSIFGQYFTRHETWAEMAKPWIDYLARNACLLQQGLNVADVAYFYGEESPLSIQGAGGALTDMPTRYAFDFVSANAILNLLAVENGNLVSPGGARYKALYLNAATARMTLPVLRKLAAFVEQGATIVGAAPQSSPSRTDDADEFAQLVRRLWSGGAETRIGGGRVIAGRDIEAAFDRIGVAPDLSHTSQADLQFVHRRLPDGDLYFVANRTGEAVDAEVRFRVVEKAPDFWRADSGRVEPASYRRDGAATVVPLALRPHESVFVVFRRRAEANTRTVAAPSLRQVGAIDGAWDVTFQPGRGAPPSTTLPALASLSEHGEPGVKYFSGVATYAKTFDLPGKPAAGAALMLDLGQVGDIADVRVNGRSAGIAWKMPFRLDIAPFVQAGANRLEIQVANVWVNRLIGDQQPGVEKVAFTAMPTYTPQAPLRPSGLIGPVTLWAAQ